VGRLTELLHSAHGDVEASRQLFELVYADLKRMAHRQLFGSKGNAVELDTTALVHESYLRLIERGRLLPADRAAFFAYVGHVMRHVVIDHVRQRLAQKRGGGEAFVTLTTGVEGVVLADERLLMVDAALDELERLAPKLRELVEMRYFAGLTLSEVAELRGISVRTVEREWTKARAFLRQLMDEG
jgi:RNA polymerase sigma factor (TIGR02999 family)